MAAEFLVRMGDRLRERRDEMGLSRADVARRMSGKVSENQIYRWEKGQHNPNPDTLEELAQILERDVGYFMAPPADEQSTSETPDLFGANEPTQLDRIERLLNELLDRLVADGILRAVEQDDQQEQPQAPSKHRRRAS